MGIPVIFISVILLTVWIQIKLRKSGKENRRGLGDFFEEEMKANAVRKKEIPKELFIVPDLSGLPIREYQEDSAHREILYRQNVVVKNARRPMLKFEKPMSNREIKYAFGTANLDVITGYEDNFDQYVTGLLKWAETLIKMENLEDAVKVLQESIAIGSDYSKSYTLLADIYFEQGDKDNLMKLYDHLKEEATFMRNVSIRYKMMAYMKALLERLDVF